MFWYLTATVLLIMLLFCPLISNSRLFGFLSQSNRGPHNLPVVKPNIQDLQQICPDFKFLWFGHSFFMVDLEGVRIMVDPVFGNASPVPFLFKRFMPVPLAREELPTIDVVLITHNHYDHLEAKTISYLARRDNIVFVVPQGVDKYLLKFGCPSGKIVTLTWWESVQIKGLQIYLTPSQHYSRRYMHDYNHSLWGSYSIIGRQHKIFFSGDGGYGKHFTEIGEKFQGFDYAFIDIGAWNMAWHMKHLFPEEALQALLDLRGRHLIPGHWAAYNLAYHSWDEPILRLVASAQDRGIYQCLLTPMLGETYREGVSKTHDWWSSWQP